MLIWSTILLISVASAIYYLDLNPDGSKKVSGVFNVKEFGAKGDGVTDDTKAINAALDSIISNDGTLYFPKGVYVVSSEIIKIPLGKIKLLGEHSIIKLVLPEETANIQTVLRFNNVTNNITFQGITIDANRYAANPLMVHNNSQDMVNVGTVKFIDCNFINGLQTDDIFYQSGVYVRGAFESVVAIRSTFKNMDSSKTTSPVSRGLHVSEDSDKDNYTKEVIVIDCVFEDIYNYTSVDSDGLSYSNKFDSSQYKEGTLIVRGTSFKNCKGRSIKSQIQSSIIIGNKFYRDKYSGNNEIDCQYAGADISDNQFFYKDYGVGVVFGGSVRSAIHKKFYMANNTVTAINAQIDTVCGVDVKGSFTLNSISIIDNKVKGTVSRFCTLRIPFDTDNRATITGNSAETSVAFLKIWSYGIGTPVLNGVFKSNIELGAAKQIELVNSLFQPSLFLDNSNINNVK